MLSGIEYHCIFKSHPNPPQCRGDSIVDSELMQILIPFFVLANTAQRN